MHNDSQFNRPFERFSSLSFASFIETNENSMDNYQWEVDHIALLQPPIITKDNQIDAIFLVVLYLSIPLSLSLYLMVNILG